MFTDDTTPPHAPPLPEMLEYLTPPPADALPAAEPELSTPARDASGRAGRGALAEFLASRYDPAASTRGEARRLLPEAVIVFPHTTFDSLANAIGRLKKAAGISTNPTGRRVRNQYTSSRAPRASAHARRRKGKKPRATYAQATALKDLLRKELQPGTTVYAEARRLFPLVAREFPGATFTEKGLRSHISRLRSGEAVYRHGRGGRKAKAPRPATRSKAKHWSQTPDGRQRLDAIKEARANGTRPLGSQVAKSEVVELAKEAARARLVTFQREIDKLKIFLAEES